MGVGQRVLVALELSVRPVFGQPETGIDPRRQHTVDRKMATCVNCAQVDYRVYMAYDEQDRVWFCETCEDDMGQDDDFGELLDEFERFTNDD